ncbi:MAG: TetR/AcrR family transcriptional regulator, partial [Rhodococcus sp. (in: high G+C Gram-positive bacteria)]
IGKMGDLAARAQAEGDIVDGIDAHTLGRYIVASFTGVQTVSEMLTGRADLQQRLTEMWQMLLPAVVPRRRLARVMAVAEDALIDWSDR